MIKKKFHKNAIIILCIIVALFFSYAIYHQNCAPAHWAYHIHRGMSYEDVAELLPDHNWVSSSRSRAVFDIGNDKSIVITFYSKTNDSSDLYVESYYFIDTTVPE